MNVLLVGGHGYIGSHVALELVRRDHEVVIVDNHSNSNKSKVESGMRRILRELYRKITTYDLEVSPSAPDVSSLYKIMKRHKIDSVVHLAGLKSVAESNSQPLNYLAYNPMILFGVLKAMEMAKIEKILFSSTAALYGNGDREPLAEDTPIKCLNAYSESKYVQERILEQLGNQKRIKYCILRYFNPIGNAPEAKIGENPPSKPNNVLPLLMRSAHNSEPFKVFGDDYDTIDGTGVRDYIDVCDLADAHVKVIEKDLFPNDIFNVGYGNGTSVLELINLVQEITARKINYEIVPRRPGDIGTCIANPNKFVNTYNWSAKSDVKKAIQSQWQWELHRSEF